MSHTEFSKNTALFSIGFTEKSAARFFTLLKSKNVITLLDVRLQNTSQLAGFAKKEDLKFFLKEICNIDYLEVPELHPESKLLKDYKNKKIDWDYYSNRYMELLEKRSVANILDPMMFDNGCLLCSEHQPHQCHRRLAIDYLNDKWKNRFKVEHLK